MKRIEMVVMVGIPGCGKTFFRNRLLPYHYAVNLDSIHAFLAPENCFDKANLGLARKIERIMIEDKLSKGVQLVVDNTNINTKVRKKYFELAEKHNAEPVAVYFKLDMETALRQNSQRGRKVPDESIRRMCIDFEMPTEAEGFSKTIDASLPRGLTGSKKAVFLDRDGVIFANKRNGKDHFVNKVADIRYIDGAVDGLKEMAKKGYDLFIASNQGGVALGYMKEETLNEINSKMAEDLAREGINLRGVYCCTHHPKGVCKCRKPETGLIIKAAREHDIDVTLSYIIGDMTSDIELGNRVKAKTILVETGFGGSDKKYPAKEDYKAKSLLEVATYLD